MSPSNSIGRRRPDPLPWGWEVPAAGVLAWLCLAAGALLAAQAAASWVSGHRWLWPDSARLFPALGGLITGHVGAGLDAPDGLPSPVLVAVLAVVFQVALLVVAGWAGWRFWSSIGPGRRHGMATRAEAETILGVGRLHRVRKLIRPDLYGRPQHRTWAQTFPSTRPVSRRRRGAASETAAQTNLQATVHTPVDDTQPEGSAAGESASRARIRFFPREVGWPVGVGAVPKTGALWVPFDRTTGVYGPQGSGKTLDALTPALLSAPGGALATLTKVEDLLLTVDSRAAGGRPVAVLDPFGLAPGLPELVWDPVDGCVDSMVAERRAKAFTAGTVKGAVAIGAGDDAARFYAAEGAKVLQAYFHAAALTGRTIEDVLEWVSNPRGATTPEEILRSHPHAAPFWHGLLHGALHGDDRTAGNTATTVQQAMALFFQESLRARCTPGPGRPATDLTDLITRGGTVYLLGRDDPYASASPLMTAIAEHVLDTALTVATASPFGRLCPSFLACLDELPSTAPLPTLRTRMANERALGLSFIYAAQTWRQLVICYGEDEARAFLVRADQRHRRVRWRQGRHLQPGAVRADRHLPGVPHHVQPWPWHRGHLARGCGRADPAARGDQAAAGTARPGHRRERETVGGQADPVRRRKTGSTAAGRTVRRGSPGRGRSGPADTPVRPSHRRRRGSPAAQPHAGHEPAHGLGFGR